MEKQDKTTSRAKRDFLRNIEQSAQAKWKQEKIFEYDAPSPQEIAKPKYFSTFPYPYMNGRLHLGHTFTVTKAEFAASYQRLKGKNSLFPFAFHCTGMPIKAVADKLKHELENKEEESENSEKTQNTKEDPLAFHATRSKLQAKTGDAKSQAEILRSMDIPEEEIPKFADAKYWLKYFPPRCQEDLQNMGASIDWRRQFITTEANPYYDSFIKWQFEHLKELGKIKFGKRYTIFSPKDGQPCMDHDRKSGEGVIPQEYVLIKQQLVEPLPPSFSSLAGKKVYLVPGTLRPETMYGQTNVWVLPEGEYGAYEVNETEVFICSERAARNMAFQNLTKESGKWNCLMKVKGTDLIGLAVKAPLSHYSIVYVLPMSTISMNKGTGIVTSVPSDSPDDFICLDEFKKKPQWRAKFGIKDEMVLPFDVVEVVEIPEIGRRSAEYACHELKIKSIKDRELLAKAKEMVYQKGFYEGKMIIGEYKDSPVKVAKPKIRDLMISKGEAVVYSEPADQVISRSGDECVVALVDQWYINYGEEEWKEQVHKHLQTMEFYSKDAKNKFEEALDWLHQWACSRNYGLGTRLPWDSQYLIDSLSDSTIYMAFYTVAHLLQGGVPDGSKLGPANIPPEKLTRSVWNYIFLKAEYPRDCGIPEETLIKLRNEFEYWYPVDLRVSGKDLINNHLIFFLYNHCAIWKDLKCWPQAIRSNGHILLNGKKMSKSEGNFLTLSEAVQKYSVDGMRFGLADAGDSLDDANFSEKTADNAILRLYTQIEWSKEMLENNNLRSPSDSIFADSVFESEINLAIVETDRHFERTNYREALQTGFYALQNARDDYRSLVGGDANMRSDLVKRFIEVQAVLLAPICPHFSEYIWSMLGKIGSVRCTSWPVAGEINKIALKMKEYLFNRVHDFRQRKDYYGKTKVPNKAIVMVATELPEWQQQVLKTIKPFFQGEAIDEKKLIAAISEENNHTVPKKVMTFVASVREQYKVEGVQAFEFKAPFDEKRFLEENIAFLKSSLNMQDVLVSLPSEEFKERVQPLEATVVFS